MSSSGTDATTITPVNSANGYNYTGSPLLVALSGNADAQAFLLTTDGLYSWGGTGEVVGGSIVTSSAFSTMSMPSGVSPSDVKEIKANTGVFFLITKTGHVYITGHGDPTGALSYVSGDGTSTANIWHHVQNSSTPGDYLTNVVELSGNSEVVYIKKSDNTIWTWGQGVAIGNAAVSSNVTYPTQVTASGIPLGVSISQIVTYSSNPFHNTTGVLALGSDAKVYGLGYNGPGEIITTGTGWVSTWTAISGPAGSGTLSNVIFLTASDNSEEYASAGVIVKSDLYSTTVAYVWGDNNTYSLGFGTDGVVQNPIPPGDFHLGSDDPAYLSLGGHATSFLNKAGSGSICFIGHITNGSNAGAGTDPTHFVCFSPGDSGWPAGVELCINKLDEISPSASTITASPTTIVANGTSTSTITVQLYTAAGVKVTTSSGTVLIGTNTGTIGTTTDNNDGTYSSILTSSSVPTAATLTFTLNAVLSPNSATVTFTGIPDSTYPILPSGQTFTYSENQTSGYSIGTVSATDNIAVTSYTIVSGNSSGYFSISPSTGTITLTDTGAGMVASNDFETTPNSFILEIQVSDAANNTTTSTIHINVTDIDDVSPIVPSGQTFSYVENRNIGYEIGTISATDNIAVTSYSIISGNSSGYFSVSPSTGTITLTAIGAGAVASNDYETSPNIFTLTVSVTDALSNTTTTTFVINVLDASDEIAPSAPATQTFSYEENQSANYEIGVVSATDNVSIASFEISSGNSDGYFSVNSTTGSLTLTPVGAGSVPSNDYETTPNSFSLIITISDTSSNTTTSTITIYVTDVTENVDSDGDGVLDNRETSDGTDPNNPCSYFPNSITLPQLSNWETLDCDNDGLSNKDEKEKYGTNPQDPDTDGDGVLDGTEVVDKTDPRNPCDYLEAHITVVQRAEWGMADCDNDGLPNSKEKELGTDPNDPDTDGDGVKDGDEVKDKTNPLDPCDYVAAHITVAPKQAWLDADCDNDGLPNSKEKELGTDPKNPDTDGDGVTDGDEVKDGTNPLDPCDFVYAHQTVEPSAAWGNLDCDHDGLPNKKEKELGTDPKNPDTDGDGVTDGDENLDGTNPLDPCSLIVSRQTVTPTAEWYALDCDNDGLPNKEELEKGTDPNNPDTDGDGVKDGDEIKDGTNPLDPCDLVLAHQTVTPSLDWQLLDCDNDGTPNQKELEIGTDPFDKDTDKDAVIDTTEVNDNTNPLDPCDLVVEHQTELASLAIWNHADCDGDGLENGGELKEDTDKDGLYNFNDPDDDNDGIPSIDEFPDPNDDESDRDGLDSNYNGIPDYLEANKGDVSKEIEVYNAVTPNGDGAHELFTVRNIEMFPNNHLEIYNRWGALVYEVDGYGVNGTYFRGYTSKDVKQLPAGVYFYILKYVNKENKTKTLQGYLYLNR